MINSMTQSIKNYLDMENIHSAIMLKGIWGCGKSYYVRNDLENELDELYKQNTENPKEIKVICISLYGLDKVEDINNAVRKQYLSSLGNTILSFKEETDEKPKSKELLKKAFGGLSAFIPGGEIISKVAESIGGSIIELLQATEIIPEINGKQVLLVFDDFERSTIDIQVLMGVINEYAENNKVKVLVVANEKEIKDKEEKPKQDKTEEIKDNKKVDKIKTTYERIKEKFIFQSIECKIDLKEQLENVVNTLKFEQIANVNEYKIFLKNNILGLSSFADKNNIRTYIFTFELYSKIYTIIENSPFEYLKEDNRKIELFKMFYLTCFISKNGEDIEIKNQLN